MRCFIGSYPLQQSPAAVSQSGNNSEAAAFSSNKPKERLNRQRLLFSLRRNHWKSWLFKCKLYA
jgi:hypothetical protein